MLELLNARGRVGEVSDRVRALRYCAGRNRGERALVLSAVRHGIFIVPSIPFDLVSPFYGRQKYFAPAELRFLMSIRFYKHFALTERVFLR